MSNILGRPELLYKKEYTLSVLRVTLLHKPALISLTLA